MISKENTSFCIGAAAGAMGAACTRALFGGELVTHIAIGMAVAELGLSAWHGYGASKEERDAFDHGLVVSAVASGLLDWGRPCSLNGGWILVQLGFRAPACVIQHIAARF